MAMTMTFYLFGALSSPTVSYSGGAGGLFLYAAFVATPFMALCHLAVAADGVSLRLTRVLWFVTALYVILIWIAFLGAMTGADEVGKGHGTWLPMVALMLVPTGVTLFGVSFAIMYPGASAVME
jgi:hypothetical protein